MYKTIIFDVDGTLLNGTEGILKSVCKAIEYFKLPMPEESVLVESRFGLLYSFQNKILVKKLSM